MFSSASLAQYLESLTAMPHYWVAYSGGVDSHVLLHALAEHRDTLPGELGAVHINHGLHDAAADWTAHCETVCRELDVPLVALTVDGRPGSGDSPEAAARTARYAALARWLPAGHALLTAQHRDDQAETLLLQLLRGSGVRGLAAMPTVAEIGAGLLLRPLLDFSREDLLAYADRHRLHWVQDPSNEDTGLDRNYLRHRVVPELRRRWPAVAQTLARSAQHCAEAARILEQVAREDVEGLTDAARETLDLPGFQRLSAERRRNALRYWLQDRCGAPPSTVVLSRILHDIPASRPDANPCVRWGGYEMRRYRDRLYLLRQVTADTPRQRLSWSLSGTLELPGAGGTLRATRATGHGLRAAAVSGPVEVLFRQGGERCRPVGRPQHHTLKKLFQERGVPPWERPRIPLIYIGGELAAVAGFWVCEPFSAAPGEPGISIEWSGCPAGRL
ncbi:MAG: tRNA lysidine(34) synthetase TilS [Gammaproteobacteria bacterium]|nr:MAG: tRNA lysidine(34) synthetase TilS [Gammaproteobacteria bacterium]